MVDNRMGACAGLLASSRDEVGPVGRGLAGVPRGTTTLILNFFVIKPIAIFVWGFSQWANRLHFHDRRELLRRLKRARAEGRPVLVAANHVSWFDDPVIPMALYATGQRAGLELVAVASLLVAWRLLPAPVIPNVVAAAAGLAAVAAAALLGARKLWWTLGDRVNLSDASVLEGKLALTRKAPPGPLLRALLRIADAAIPWFMRSGATKTVLLDRRPGNEAKRDRASAVSTALALAERLEPVWVFFEGGRTRVPGEIAPARHGIGSLVQGLRERGHEPLVVVVVHRGMERLIPPGGSRFLSCGHTVDVDWDLFEMDRVRATVDDAQAIADAVREVAVRLQASTRLPGVTRA